MPASPLQGLWWCRLLIDNGICASSAAQLNRQAQWAMSLLTLKSPVVEQMCQLVRSVPSCVTLGIGLIHISGFQRQLITLARALLRRSQVVILDESTASCDLNTDIQVQRTIREELSESIVITIAHRLETVSFTRHFRCTRYLPI